ncbi:MAG: hypothetical protein HYV09_10060 [Deltaproteobacteria bacterium]|nr:hypothetical protein [Deltaproteobacteria bacterium]
MAQPETRGNLLGTAILGAVDYFIKKWGPAAAHTTITRLSQASRAFVTPNAPSLGILAARRYPYPFVGELFRTMAAVAKVPEDAFIREITAAGMDANLDTVGRVILRWAVTPQMIARRAQDMWNTFHDSGKVTVRVVSEHEYVSDVTDWPNHDVTVCKVAAEARRRIMERTGAKNVDVSRLACVSWGHDRCTFRVKWD